MTYSTERKIIQAMQNAGLRSPREIITDGKIHRFSANYNKAASNISGWYIFNEIGSDFISGAFGDWSQDITGRFRSKEDEELTPELRILFQRKQQEMQEQLKAEKEAAEEEASRESAERFRSYEPASLDHPYLKKKGLKNAYGAKTDGVNLVLPAMDITGKIWSLQTISADGAKLFKSGGRLKGCFWQVGAGFPSFLAEGYATAASVYEATGKPCLIAYSANNLPNVAQIFPYVTIVADNDESGTGEKYAKKASELTGCKVVLIPEKGMDANDYYTSGGNLRALLIAPPRLRMYLGSEFFTNVTPRRWLVRDWIPAENSFGFLYGDSGSGKTFLALDMMLSIVTGLDDWSGYKIRQGRVLYLCGEGAHGLKYRVKAWMAEHGVSALPAEYWANTESSELLDTQDGIHEIITSLDYYAFRPELIVIDTLNRFMEGDENSAQDATRFIRGCQYLQNRYDACVMLVHHIGIEESAKKRVRGSSAFKGNSDFQYLVQKTGANGITLTQMKQKDVKEQKPLHFVKKEVILPDKDEDGMNITSAVLEHSDAPQTEEKKFTKYHRDLIRYFRKRGYIVEGKAYIKADALRECIRDDVLERAEEGEDEKAISRRVRNNKNMLIEAVPELLIAKKNIDGTPAVYTFEIVTNGTREPVFSMNIKKTLP